VDDSGWLGSTKVVPISVENIRAVARQVFLS
jgi:hypothetical protein